MQIVIDIPEEMMSYINKNEFNAISEAAYGSMAMLAIKNGTPLPKGHGRLGDLDRLSKKFLKKDVEDFNESFEALAGWFLRTCNHEDTIIEADKAESEE